MTAKIDATLEILLDELDGAAAEQANEGTPPVDAAKQAIREYVASLLRSAPTMPAQETAS